MLSYWCRIFFILPVMGDTNWPKPESQSLDVLGLGSWLPLVNGETCWPDGSVLSRFLLVRGPELRILPRACYRLAIGTSPQTCLWPVFWKGEQSSFGYQPGMTYSLQGTFPWSKTSEAGIQSWIQTDRVSQALGFGGVYEQALSGYSLCKADVR